MWRDVAEYIQKLFKLKEQVDGQAARLASLEEEVSTLSRAVIDLQYQLSKRSEEERHEREKLTLRLEIVLLRFERQITAGSSSIPPLSANEDSEGSNSK